MPLSISSLLGFFSFWIRRSPLTVALSVFFAVGCA
jgi:hypothetical protein